MSCKYQIGLLCHALGLLTVSCGGGGLASPVAPTVIRETIVVGPSALPPPPPGPHFALELQALNANTFEGDPWMGTVAVFITPTILRPELPARVVVSCGSSGTHTFPLGSGIAQFSCLLPIGSHSIGAVADMGDGRRFPTAITARVLERPTLTLPLYYDVILSSQHWTDVSFGTQTYEDVNYHWDFGDGGIDTTRINSASHRYDHPGPGGNKERIVTVRIVRRSDGKTLATGSVIGKW